MPWLSGKRKLTTRVQGRLGSQSIAGFPAVNVRGREPFLFYGPGLRRSTSTQRQRSYNKTFSISSRSSNVILRVIGNWNGSSNSMLLNLPILGLLCIVSPDQITGSGNNI